jgi:hypothetical protein
VKEASLMLVIGGVVGLMDRASMGGEQLGKMCGEQLGKIHVGRIPTRSDRRQFP